MQSPGLDVYVPDKKSETGFRKTASIRYAVRVNSGVSVGGYFHVTPDGEYVVFHNGAVIAVHKATVNAENAATVADPDAPFGGGFQGGPGAGGPGGFPGSFPVAWHRAAVRFRVGSPAGTRSPAGWPRPCPAHPAAGSPRGSPVVCRRAGWPRPCPEGGPLLRAAGSPRGSPAVCRRAGWHPRCPGPGDRAGWLPRAVARVGAGAGHPAGAAGHPAGCEPPKQIKPTRCSGWAFCIGRAVSFPGRLPEPVPDPADRLDQVLDPPAFSIFCRSVFTCTSIVRSRTIDPPRSPRPSAGAG